MTSQPCYQTIIIHILPNISRNKGNQAMKFGQLIEYNITWETIFLKNHTQNVVEKLLPDPFLENLNWAYLAQYSEVLYSLFLLYPKSRAMEMY